jgi:hypothetical protein
MLHTLPQRYLMPSAERSMVVGMPDIILRDTPEARKAFRIASMMHSAKQLERLGFRDAAMCLRVLAASLKHGVPDGCTSFSDGTEDIEVVHG